MRTSLISIACCLVLVCGCKGGDDDDSGGGAGTGSGGIGSGSGGIGSGSGGMGTSSGTGGVGSGSGGMGTSSGTGGMTAGGSGGSGSGGMTAGGSGGTTGGSGMGGGDSGMPTAGGTGGTQGDGGACPSGVTCGGDCCEAGEVCGSAQVEDSDIDWTDGVGDDGELEVVVGAKLNFTFDEEYHDVYMFPDQTAFTGCNFTSADMLSETSPYVWTAASAGDFYFGCSTVSSFGNHCVDDNMKLHVIVKAAGQACVAQ